MIPLSANTDQKRTPSRILQSGIVSFSITSYRLLLYVVLQGYGLTSPQEAFNDPENTIRLQSPRLCHFGANTIILFPRRKETRKMEEKVSQST